MRPRLFLEPCRGNTLNAPKASHRAIVILRNSMRSRRVAPICTTSHNESGLTTYALSTTAGQVSPNAYWPMQSIDPGVIPTSGSQVQ